MTEEESNNLIAEAIRRYPIGTLINSTGGTFNAEVTNHNFYWDSSQLRSDGSCAVYDKRDKGTWALITKQAEPVINNNYQIY